MSHSWLPSRMVRFWLSIFWRAAASILASWFSRSSRTLRASRRMVLRSSANSTWSMEASASLTTWATLLALSRLILKVAPPLVRRGFDKIFLVYTGRENSAKAPAGSAILPEVRDTKLTWFLEPKNGPHADGEENEPPRRVLRRSTARVWIAREVTNLRRNRPAACAIPFHAVPIRGSIPPPATEAAYGPVPQQ